MQDDVLRTRGQEPRTSGTLFGIRHDPVPSPRPLLNLGIAMDPYGPGGNTGPGAPLWSGPDERFRDVYRRSIHPDDPFELRDLYLGRVEADLGPLTTRPDLARMWLDRPVLRDVDDETILNSRATSRFVKELFNWFFRDDLYGRLRRADHTILSSGSVDEMHYGLPPVLKQCLRYALDRDWYGYSDSRGRMPAREAIAWLENARVEGEPYGAENVAIAMGGTSAMSAVADLVLSTTSSVEPAVCALPNYPPLVEAVARRHDIHLVPLSCYNEVTSLAPLTAALRPTTPLVLLQTATNPTGTSVSEAELAALIQAAGPDTVIVLDECHELLGAERQRSGWRADPRVVRVSSLSKSYSVPGLKLGWILGSAGFVAEFYEYASTTYGGPPSFYYTLVEVIARLERMLLSGIEPGAAEVAEFEPSYGVNLNDLSAAFRSFRAQRIRRTEALVGLRDEVSSFLAGIGAQVVRAKYSMNVLTRLVSGTDDYVLFRRLLAEAGTAVLPGILTYCLSGGWVRLTTARDPATLASALPRLKDYVARDRSPVGLGSRKA